MNMHEVWVSVKAPKTRSHAVRLMYQDVKRLSSAPGLTPIVLFVHEVI